ncbi:M1 family metallopeptidase [Psychroflexus aestuariivivens]|uniref:M1 family metallopeptidase n=1 Tax=Psychroflexus aestuariivivens TaxID=1795040 RepID=UPI000FD88FE0|nr:M1 family aminopeptidase [Psychroflexus aestuariivivens]
MKLLLSLFFAVFTSTCFSQQIEIVDFKKINATIKIDTIQQKVSGTFEVEFEILKDTDSVFLDAKAMNLNEVLSEKIKITTSADKIWFKNSFKAKETYQAKFKYECEPKQTLYFVGFNTYVSNNSSQVWSQGQGKYTSHWLPSLDDMNDKIVFNINYAAPKNYEVIANGILNRKRQRNDFNLWEFEMKKPMSSYLVAVAMGDFIKFESQSISGNTPIGMYLSSQDKANFESTYKYHQQIFNILEDEIGVKYPWENFKQVPVRDFLYAGMENTTLNIFSEEFVVDEIGFNDRNFVNVQAHELAHQWFGNLVTETDSEHHWLHEGFATYYALLVEKEIFGDDYFYYKLYESAEQLKVLSDQGKGEKLLNSKASSLTFYQKGAWTLVILKNLVGEYVFNQAVKNYLEKHKFQNVKTEDFMSEVEALTQVPLDDFKKNWLNQSAFQSKETLEILEQNELIKKYLKLAALREIGLNEKKEFIDEALDFPVNDYLGQEAVYQLSGENLELAKPYYKKAFETNNIYVRQAIANSMTKIPKSLQSEYESLLTDESYVTIEKALLNLWQNFPENRHEYLDFTSDVIGFQDKNVRMLWLTLNLITSDYQPELEQEVFARLSQYTSPGYAYQIREHAFGYLYQINTFTFQNYLDLMEGVFHPVWRFRKFCRELLDTLNKDQVHANKLKSLVNQFSEKQKTFFNNRY